MSAKRETFAAFAATPSPLPAARRHVFRTRVVSSRKNRASATPSSCSAGQGRSRRREAPGSERRPSRTSRHRTSMCVPYRQRSGSHCFPDGKTCTRAAGNGSCDRGLRRRTPRVRPSSGQRAPRLEHGAAARSGPHCGWHQAPKAAPARQALAGGSGRAGVLPSRAGPKPV